jgi:hypothetical protein
VTEDRVEALESLLTQAEEAHGVYESSELHGVYDEQWPRWYAQYAMDHGIAALIGRDVTVDELAELLAKSWAETQRTEAEPADSWARATARRLARGT